MVQNKFDMTDDEAPVRNDTCSIPYSVMEMSVDGELSAQKIIAPEKARKILAERELAYRMSEGQLI